MLKNTGTKGKEVDDGDDTNQVNKPNAEPVATEVEEKVKEDQVLEMRTITGSFVPEALVAIALKRFQDKQFITVPLLDEKVWAKYNAGRKIPTIFPGTVEAIVYGRSGKTNSDTKLTLRIRWWDGDTRYKHVDLDDVVRRTDDELVDGENGMPDFVPCTVLRRETAASSNSVGLKSAAAAAAAAAGPVSQASLAPSGGSSKSRFTAAAAASKTHLSSAATGLNFLKGAAGGGAAGGFKSQHTTTARVSGIAFATDLLAAFGTQPAVGAGSTRQSCATTAGPAGGASKAKSVSSKKRSRDELLQDLRDTQESADFSSSVAKNFKKLYYTEEKELNAVKKQLQSVTKKLNETLTCIASNINMPYFLASGLPAAHGACVCVCTCKASAGSSECAATAEACASTAQMPPVAHTSTPPPAGGPGGVVGSGGCA